VWQTRRCRDVELADETDDSETPLPLVHSERERRR
jgi:hypothetical protein